MGLVKFLASAAVVAMAVPAAAAIVVDQSNMPVPGGYAGGQVWSNGTTGQQSAQTFTVGVSGYLAQVDVMAAGNQPYSVDLRILPTVAGQPIAADASALASATFTSPTWSTPSGFSYSIISVDLSSFNLFLNAGDVIAIALSASPNSPMVFGGWAAGGMSYAGGRSWGRTGPNLNWGNNGGSGSADLHFRTYMSDTPFNNGGGNPVPEPGIVGLLGLGVLGVAVARRRKAAA